jgi:hypothetical protein
MYALYVLSTLLLVQSLIPSPNATLLAGGFLNEFLMIYKLILQPTEFLAKLIEKYDSVTLSAWVSFRLIPHCAG